MNKNGYKPGTLAWLSQIYYSEGADKARRVFEELPQSASHRGYNIIKSDAAQISLRTDVAAQDDITYYDFSAPSHWELPFTILRARFGFQKKDRFMSHAGEEVLIPVEGEIFYHFFCSPKPGKQPSRIELKPLKYGELLSLNPAIPHHTWGGKRHGTAWMIIRHLRDTQTALAHTSKNSANNTHPGNQLLTEDQLSDPALYAMYAWEIAERLRFYRERSGCRITEIANACGIDPSHASRIESGEANASLETLKVISDFLNLGLDKLIAPTFARPFERDKIVAKTPGKKAQSREHYFSPQIQKSFKFLRSWSIPQGRNEESEESIAEVSAPSSWVVLDGQVVFETEKREKSASLLVETGDVIHFKGTVAKRIYGLKPSRLIQLVYTRTARPEEAA